MSNGVVFDDSIDANVCLARGQGDNSVGLDILSFAMWVYITDLSANMVLYN